jgi:NADPH2:quinone reductase
MHAIHIGEYGGPEVMIWTELPDPVPAPGKALVRLGAAGVNFMGRVTALGDGVRDLTVGDRVAWYYHRGSYAEQLAIPATSLLKVPDEVDDETAAALMMQGLTANHFTTETYAVQPGDTAVVHAAAGGVGQILTQLVKARGGTVIGLVSREEKVRVKELTNGEGAHVVYDGGGPETLPSSQQALRAHGVHAYYGVIMGDMLLDPRKLPNSILLSYPTVADHVRTREALVKRTNELFDFVRKGQLTPRIGQRYALADAAQAHVDIESRRTTGKLLLVP